MKRLLIYLLLFAVCPGSAGAAEFVLPRGAVSRNNGVATNLTLVGGSVSGATNTGGIFIGPTITGGTVASALTGTNAALTTPQITGATLTGVISGGTFTNGTLAGNGQYLTNLTAANIAAGTITASLAGMASGATNSLSQTNGTHLGGTFTGSTNTAILITGTNTLTGHVTVNGVNTGLSPLVVVGTAGMTANLQDWKTNAGGTLASVLPKGVFSGQGLTLSGQVYPSTDYTISRLSSDMYWEGTSGGYFYIRPNGQGNNSGLVRIGAPNILLCTNVSIGAIFNPGYTLDVSGAARLAGTNAIWFGGTAGVADADVSLGKHASGEALLTGMLKTSGNMAVGFVGAGASANFHVKGAGASAPIAIIGSTGNSPTNDFLALQLNGTNKFTVNKDFVISQPGTITTAGTTGAQTINKPLGSVNFAAAASTLVVTCSAVGTAADTLVFLQVTGTDSTFTDARVTVGTGQFTITANAAATAETAVLFEVKKIK